MAIKIKKIKEIMKDYYPSVTTIDWHGENIKCKRVIPLTDEETFINICVSSAFNDEGTYCPNHCDFVTKVSTIKMYTDVDLPEDIEELNAIIYLSDLYSSIVSGVDSEQYDEILRSIDKKVGYLLNVQQFESVNKIEKVIDSMSSFADSIESSFKGIDSEALNNIIADISKNGISEEKIANAVISSINKE